MHRASSFTKSWFSKYRNPFSQNTKVWFELFPLNWQSQSPACSFPVNILISLERALEFCVFTSFCNCQGTAAFLEKFFSEFALLALTFPFLSPITYVTGFPVDIFLKAAPVLIQCSKANWAAVLFLGLHISSLETYTAIAIAFISLCSLKTSIDLVMVLENFCPSKSCNQGAGKRRGPSPMAHGGTRDLIIGQSLGTAKHNLGRDCKYIYVSLIWREKNIAKGTTDPNVNLFTQSAYSAYFVFLPIWEVEHQLFAQGRPGPDLAEYFLLAQRCGRCRKWAEEQLQAEERSCQQTSTSHTPWMRCGAHYCSYCAGFTLSMTPFQSDIPILIISARHLPARLIWVKGKCFPPFSLQESCQPYTRIKANRKEAKMYNRLLNNLLDRKLRLISSHWLLVVS